MLEASSQTKWKVGLFTIGALIIFGYLSVYVNNHPYWWRPCEIIQVTVEDATGLKTKTPVKTLGLDIGYVKKIGLVGNTVQIKICVTAPVDVTPATRAYVRSEGFLGDRFLELKPVVYLGDNPVIDEPAEPVKAAEPEKIEEPAKIKTAPHSHFFPRLPASFKLIAWVSHVAVPSAFSQGTASKQNKEVPVAEKSADVQQVMNQVNGLMVEVKAITSSLKESINPDEIKGAVRQLNKTLENAAKIISPEGSLSSTAQRSLLKLEDAIDQLRDQVTKINQGQGSLGKLLNDPVYADELQKALINMNKLLNRANSMRLAVSLGIQQLSAYNGSRGFFELSIWTRPDRYYFIGMTSDPRGTVSQTTTTTLVGAESTTVQSTKVDQGGFAISMMLGKVFAQRFDFSLGLLYGDGAASFKVNLGPTDNVEMLQLVNSLYFRAKGSNGAWTVQPDFRSHLLFQPFSIFYLSGGIEGLKSVGGKVSLTYGGGLRFDDDDIKLLFTFL